MFGTTLDSIIARLEGLAQTVARTIQTKTDLAEDLATKADILYEAADEASRKAIAIGKALAILKDAGVSV